MKNKLKISKENKMNKEDLKQFTGKNKPIIEMIPGKTMPLYLFIADTECSWANNKIINIMITIIHHIKTDKLELRGRVRFEDTGNKIILGGKKQFEATNLIEAKAEIMKLYNDMVDQMNLKELRRPFELEFMINESSESIIQKMNNSNMFNIGTIAKK